MAYSKKEQLPKFITAYCNKCTADGNWGRQKPVTPVQTRSNFARWLLNYQAVSLNEIQLGSDPKQILSLEEYQQRRPVFQVRCFDWR